MAERTGSRVFNSLWPYVGEFVLFKYILCLSTNWIPHIECNQCSNKSHGVENMRLCIVLGGSRQCRSVKEYCCLNTRETRHPTSPHNRPSEEQKKSLQSTQQHLQFTTHLSNTEPDIQCPYLDHRLPKLVFPREDLLPRLKSKRPTNDGKQVTMADSAAKLTPPASPTASFYDLSDDEEGEYNTIMHSSSGRGVKLLFSKSKVCLNSNT